MNGNFEYQTPTHIYFGDNKLDLIGTELSKYGKKVLMVYDSGWIKDTSWYPMVIKSIEDAELELYELGGIQPNPVTTKVNEAATICKNEGIDVMLAIGGGSVIDTCKLASPTVFYDGNC